MSPIVKLIAVLSGFAVAAMSTQAGAAPASPFGPTVRDQVGVCIHFTDAQPGEMDMLSRCGFGLIRTDLHWSDTERQPGVYDFSAYDRLLADLDAHNIRALLILDYGNSLYDNGRPPQSEAARIAFAKWAAAAVTHFKGRHVLWEMWNEPNPNWADDYVKLALETGRAIRAAEPNEVYIGPAEAGTDPRLLETCFTGGLLNYWRGVSVHPYRINAPENAMPEYRALQSLIAKYEPARRNIPLLDGEWGYSVIPNGNTYSFVTTDAMQAAYFDREVLTDEQDGVPLTVWYDWRNDADDPANTEANFGLVRYAYHSGQDPVFDPKPAYTAARAFLSILGPDRFSRVVPVTGSSTAMLFSFAGKREHRYAAYTTANAPETVTLPVPAGNYTVLDISGAVEKSVACGRAGMALTLTGDTQFVIPTR